MSSRICENFRRLLTESRGAEIAEAAAVLPLMFMILLGIFWFGQAFSIYGAITRAAQEGARAGSIPYCATCNNGNSPALNAVTAVQNALIASRLDPSKAQYPIPAPLFNSCGGNSACGGASANICVQSPVQIANTNAGGGGVCAVSVTFRYPYQFWLPFTSLNKQQIWINASARMRLENH